MGTGKDRAETQKEAWDGSALGPPGPQSPHLSSEGPRGFPSLSLKAPAQVSACLHSQPTPSPPTLHLGHFRPPPTPRGPRSQHLVGVPSELGWGGPGAGRKRPVSAGTMGELLLGL